MIFILLAVIAVEYEIRPIPKERFWLIIIGVLLALFAGFRDVSVSRDYEPYIGSFNAIMTSDAEGLGLLPLFEPGFVLIVKISYSLFINNAHVAVMLAFAVLSVALKIYTFEKLAFNPFLVLLLYYCHYFLFQEMTQIRNGLACSLFFVAIYFHLEGKRVFALGSIALAFLFHNSSILYLLLLFLRKDSFNVLVYSSLFFLAMILGVLKVPFLSMLVGFDLNLISNKLTTYVDIAEKGYFDNVRFFNVLNTVNCIMTGYLLYYVIRFKPADNRLTLFLKCNIISLFTYGILIDVPSVAARFAESYGAVFPFLFAYGARILPFGKMNVLAVIGVAMIFFYINMFYGQLLQPYDLIRFR